MPIIQGNTSITAVNHQSTSIQSVYHGSTQVFTAGVSVTIVKPAGSMTVYYKANGASSYTSTTATSTVVTCNKNSVLYIYVTTATGYVTEFTSSSPQHFTIGTVAKTVTPLVIQIPTVNITKTKVIRTTYDYELSGVTNNDSSSITAVSITDTSGNTISLGETIDARAIQTYSTPLGIGRGSLTFTFVFKSNANGASSHNYTLTVTP